MTRAADSAEWDEAIVIALGGNLGDVEAVLGAALDRLSTRGLTVKARSRWWRSAAWPDPRQPAFLNGVAVVDTGLPPETLLDALLAVERSFGRVRSEPNAPRTLDLDLIAYGRLVRTGAALTLPHPRAHQRLFVMGPLAEVAPNWRHPVSGRTAAELAADAEQGRDAAPLP